MSVVGLWGGMALKRFPLPLAKDEIEVGSAMGMLQFCPLHPYTSADNRAIRTHGHTYICTHSIRTRFTLSYTPHSKYYTPHSKYYTPHSKYYTPHSKYYTPH